ncbi:MAG: hypothetical protein ACRCX2_18870 [Paraclostridium sp.]
MSKQLKLRRGTTAEHASFTGGSGEVTIDTDKNVVIVHDGSTVGGIPQAKDAFVVHNTGDETISGTKTFSSTIQGSISGNADTLDGNHASAFQAALVSGSNIKTINGNSLLGSGDITAGEATWVANDSRAKTALNSSGTAPIYACRAWVNFNGTGTVAIRASGNVSSITDNGTGIFQVNLTTAMPDVNFAVTSNCTTEATGSVQIASQNTSTCVLYCRQINANVISFFDPSIVSVAIFR